jgi:hypothetical protein
MRLFMARVRWSYDRDGEKVRCRMGPYPVLAENPVLAAEYLVDALIGAAVMPVGRRCVVLVCEHELDGIPGLKRAAKTDGDIRYDVVYDGAERDVKFSERSYAEAP